MFSVVSPLIARAKNPERSAAQFELVTDLARAITSAQSGDPRSHRDKCVAKPKVKPKAHNC
jgi:hypothetical protein